MGRQEALALLKNWYLSSSSSRQVPATAWDQAAEADAGAGASERQGARRAPLTEEGDGDLWRDDLAFLSWVEGGSGAARIALELKVGCTLRVPSLLSLHAFLPGNCGVFSRFQYVYMRACSPARRSCKFEKLLKRQYTATALLGAPVFRA